MIVILLARWLDSKPPALRFQLLSFGGNLAGISETKYPDSAAKTLKVVEVTFLTSHVHRFLAHPWVFNETLQGVVISVMVRTNAPHVLHHSHVIVQVGIISSNFAISQHTGLTAALSLGTSVGLTSQEVNSRYSR